MIAKLKHDWTREEGWPHAGNSERSNMRCSALGRVWRGTVIRLPTEAGWHWYLSAIAINCGPGLRGAFMQLEEIGRGFNLPTEEAARVACEEALAKAIADRGVCPC